MIIAGRVSIMSHIAGRKGHMKDAKKEAHGKGSQSRERTYMVDNKLIPRVRKVSVCLIKDLYV